HEAEPQRLKGYLYTPRSYDIPPCRFHGAPMACQSQRGLPLCPTNDHISSISASASPARSRSQATSPGFSVRSNAVFTDSSMASFFLSARSTVLGQICVAAHNNNHFGPQTWQIAAHIICNYGASQTHTMCK